EGALDELFALEKGIVLDVLDRLGVTLTAAERERFDHVPTRNLEAFLAYSRGLLEEDAGRYGEAAEFYAEAVALDPGFAEAAEKLAEAEAVAAVAGSVDVALGAARA